VLVTLARVVPVTLLALVVPVTLLALVVPVTLLALVVPVTLTALTALVALIELVAKDSRGVVETLELIGPNERWLFSGRASCSPAGSGVPISSVAAGGASSCGGRSCCSPGAGAGPSCTRPAAWGGGPRRARRSSARPWSSPGSLANA
jgi:uncharacterized membrane protein YgcG